MLLPNQCMTNRPRTFSITQTWCARPIASSYVDGGRGGPHRRQKWPSSVQLKRESLPTLLHTAKNDFFYIYLQVTNNFEKCKTLQTNSFYLK